MLPLLAVLLGIATAQAQTEEGVVYTLTTRCIPADAATNSPASSTHQEGESVYVSQSSRSGFQFIQWEDEAGNVVSTSRSFYYTMPAHDVTLIARYEYNPNSPAEPSVPAVKKRATVHIEMMPAEGCSYIYANSTSYYAPEDIEFEVGTTANFRAYAKTGFRFVNWTKDGEVVSTSSSFSLTITEGVTSLVANFVYDPTAPAEPGEAKFYRTLTLQSNPAEAVSSFSGKGEHINGTSFNVSASPNQYYVFENWTDEDGNIVSETQSFSYTMPNKHTTLTANYHYDFNPANPNEPGSPSIDDQGIVGRPRMTMKDDTHVLILCATPGATIHYTLDGTEPTTASDVYTDAVFVPGNIIVKAIAVKEGMTDSEVTTYQVTSYRTAMPTIAFDSGKIKMTTTTSGATIHYTVDNSDPTADSPAYTAPIDPDENILIKAIACHADLTDSDIATYIFTREEHLMEDPTFSLAADGKLVITPSVAGSTIRYTLDGTAPTATSTLYAGPITLTRNGVVKAYASHPNYFDSSVVEYLVEGFTVATPTYEYKNLALTLAVATEGAEIRYTLDGTTPTETSALYSAPLNLTEDCTVTARGFKTNFDPSETVKYTFVYADHQVATTTLSYDAEAKTVTMACATENAEIRYTVDGVAPTESTGIKYEGPIAVVGNHTYTAVAFRSDMFASEAATLVVEAQKVPTPTATYANLQLTLSCTDADAKIHYTTDGSAPTAASTLYTAPIPLTVDCTVRFIAVRDNFKDSDVESYEFRVADHQVPTPTATYGARQLTLACSDAEAQIHYTMDGSAPTATSTRYTAPISLTTDCTVRFIAVRQNYVNSAEGAYSFSVEEHRVAAPVVSHSIQTMKATMTTATQGASIRYTTDGTEPTATTGTLYQAPIDLTGNVTFTAKAFHSDLFDSETTVYSVDNMKLPTPRASYSRHALTLTCEDTSAEIRYTTDGSAPTATSTLYTAPIALTADCTVRFIAAKPQYVSSDEANYRFVLADWQEAMPTISKDFDGRKITISQAKQLPVSVSIDGNVQTLQTPATIDVYSTMSALTVVAVSQDADRYDSQPLQDALIFHKAPTFDYDGHTFRVLLGAGEPAAAAAECLLYVDDTLDAEASAKMTKDIDDFCLIKARIHSASAFLSDEASMVIDAYNTGRVIGVRGGQYVYRLIGTWGDNPADYEYLRLVGDLSKSDLQAVAALPQLTTLHVEADSMAEDDYAGVFEGSRIETIFSSHYPKGMLIGMPRLTTVMWGNSEEPMPSGILTEAGNPNLLFWTPSFDMLPEDAFNVVEYAYAPDGVPTDPAGAGVSGHAGAVFLQDGYPFQAHMPLVADYMNFKKTFTLPTEPNACSGWESIVLPFTAVNVSHERQGSIVPFAAWDGSNPDPYAGEKPFWLYNANGNGWEEAKLIEAGVPYIISMPNSKEYVESYNLDGEVTFWTGEPTQLGTSDSAPKIADWKDGFKFEGTFMPVEEEDILSLNVNNAAEGEYRGSAFVADDVTLPFGAFVRSQGAPSAIPVFGNISGVQQLPGIVSDGILVDSPAAGMLRISSARQLHTAIFTPEGAAVKTVDVRAGETLTVEGLTRGLYIVAGVKVMVR